MTLVQGEPPHPGLRAGGISELSPRGLNRNEAARYCGIGRDLFDRLVSRGLLPKPIRFGRRLVWDRHALDQAFDRISSFTGQRDVQQTKAAILEAIRRAP